MSNRNQPTTNGKASTPIDWGTCLTEHQGWLRSVNALGQAAAAIGESDEAQRCASFLRDSSPEAASALADGA